MLPRIHFFFFNNDFDLVFGSNETKYCYSSVKLKNKNKSTIKELS